ncbi:MAG: methylmalonyl Co-A mutase-associated GTPase MeaB [Acidimicrobiaceae bacterium]|nr:methylmalonyl Co-A mutase-associated GTPase MeaB [Acidimicrobiaceae bacterium]MBD27597.1 methylmalonyl Co-A mutase-associated GTPase MeaB [Acidimicrobiaceae bacterium]
MAIEDSTVISLVEKASKGDRRSVGRLLTLVERGGAAAEQVAEVTHNLSDKSHVIGITGAPGAGKSTLTASLARDLATSEYKPAVLAVDPSSPLTGGAILGDRVRMEEASEAGAFIRSMATRGHAGGLALAVPGMVRVFDAFGFNPIIIETVGVGQVEVDVASAADTVVVVVTSGWGDAVQANKAGLLEIADLFVVNKADRPGASDARRDLELMIDLSQLTGQTVRRPEIVMTTATEGEGLDKFKKAIFEHREFLFEEEQISVRRSKRWKAEVGSRLDYLISEIVKESIENLEEKEGSSPGSVAREIAKNLLKKDELR